MEGIVDECSHRNIRYKALVTGHSQGPCTKAISQ